MAPQPAGLSHQQMMIVRRTTGRSSMALNRRASNSDLLGRGLRFAGLGSRRRRFGQPAVRTRHLEDPYA